MTNVNVIQIFLDNHQKIGLQSRAIGRLRNGRIDLIGPLPTKKGQTEFVILAVDYFTKWAKTDQIDSQLQP